MPVNKNRAAVEIDNKPRCLYGFKPRKLTLLPVINYPLGAVAAINTKQGRSLNEFLLINFQKSERFFFADIKTLTSVFTVSGENGSKICVS